MAPERPPLTRRGGSWRPDRLGIPDTAALVLAVASVLVVFVTTALPGHLPFASGGAARHAAEHADAPAARPPSGPVPFPTDGPIGVSARGPLPDRGKLAAALRGPLADPAFDGPPELEVRDLSSGTLLVDRNRNLPQSPASTAKLATAAVALTELGPNARLTTRVYLAGGKLYLVGAGDPTLTRGSSPPGRPQVARIDELARQVRAAGIRDVPALVGDASLFSGPAVAPGWPPHYLGSEISPISALTVDTGKSAVFTQLHDADPSRAATEALRNALGRAGVRVGSIALGHLPPGGRVVGRVQSPPVSILVEQMLSLSDNDLAEALGRVVAVHGGRPGDFAGASASVLDGLRRLGLPTQGTVLRDTSGLSPQDRMSPELLVAILRMAADPAHPVLAPILHGLPVAGRTGTLDDRYHSADTAAGFGAVRAKTGRVLGVASLAGIVTTKDGRRLVFSVRGPAPGLQDGEHALDRIASVLATCGCR